MLSGRRNKSKPSNSLLWLSRSALANGIRISGGSGSGKSVLAAQIVFSHFLRGIPTVILDPHGGTIDYFLANVWKWGKSGQISKAEQQRLWRRIVSVDMSGKSGRVHTFPLYYRLGNESLHEISQRYLSTIARLDPTLKTASIEGFNALDSVLTPAGMIMAALDLQVTEIADDLDPVFFTRGTGPFPPLPDLIGDPDHPGLVDVQEVPQVCIPAPQAEDADRQPFHA